MINKDYKYSKIYSNIEELELTADSSYIYSYSPEGRSRIVDELKSINFEIDFLGISISNSEEDVIDFKGETFLLRNVDSINLFLTSCKKTVYIDVTGMSTRVSAALLKVMLNDENIDKFDIRILYIEPETYNIGSFKSAGVFNDLAESTEGIKPLPGFASIIPSGDDTDTLFVALLGFEGGRFTQIIESEQPQYERIIPVIGVPGFRIEYPFIALWGNRQPLDSTKSWGNMRYVAANSIVDSFKLLIKIHEEMPHKKIKTAPIGTKPHAIGAILFAIKHPRCVELIYDNPIRKNERTQGIGLITETFVNQLIAYD